ncbi:MAG TPA: DUF4439 domain-containing protein [Motilibacteraceae bacterium]|nr:DUF4439 domain-containing protein [Motilibacteraceae bacterium]
MPLLHRRDLRRAQLRPGAPSDDARRDAPLTSRRAVLAAGSLAGIALLTGCTSSSSPRPPAGPSPDDLALARARADAADLLALTEAGIAAQPTLAERLAPVAAAARAHLDALTPVLNGTPVASSPASTPGGSGTPAGASPTPSSTPTVPAAPAAALAAVTQAVRSGADRRLADLTSVTGGTARLLASLAAWGRLRAAALTGSPSAEALPDGPAQAPEQAGQALARAWEGERAAAYGFGLLGPRLDTAGERQARAAYDLHLTLAARAQQLLAAAGVRPSQAAPAWAPTAPVTGAPAARRLAADLESRTAALWADVVAAVPAQGVAAAQPTPSPPASPSPSPSSSQGVDGLRREAAALLASATARSLTWGAALPAFPGLPERG